MDLILNLSFLHLILIFAILNFNSFVQSSKKVYLTKDNEPYYLGHLNNLNNFELVDYFQNLSSLFYNQTNNYYKNYNISWGVPKLNQKENSIITFPKTQAQIGIDYYKLLAITKDNKQLTVNKDYYINNTITSEIISSGDKNKEILYKPFRSDWVAECKFESFKSKYKLVPKGDSNIIKLVSYRGLGFALININNGGKWLYIVKSANMSITYTDFNDYSNDVLNSLTEIVDIFIIDQLFISDNAFLVIVLKHEIILYQLLPIINKDSINISIDVTIKLYSDIKSNIYLSPRNITGIGILTKGIEDQQLINELIITSLDKGIALVKNDYKTNKWELTGVVTTYTNNKESKIINLSVHDFIINESTLYIIIPNFGLKIFNTANNVDNSMIKHENMVNNDNTDNNDNTEIIENLINNNNITNCFSELKFYIYHPNFKKIDNYYNYLTGNKFVGISIETDVTYSEFFIELVINNEISPLINKIFYSPFLIDSDFFVTGDDFSYIFNRDKNNLIIFRRGLINPINEMTYVVNIGSSLRSSKDNPSQISLLYDSTYNKMGISLLAANNFLISINDFVFKDEQLSCSFNEPGNYLLEFFSQSEKCEGLESDQPPYCYITIKSSLLVVEKVTPYLKTLKIILGVMAGFIVIIIIVVVVSFAKVKCTRDFIDDNNKRLNLILNTLKGNIKDGYQRILSSAPTEFRTEQIGISSTINNVHNVNNVPNIPNVYTEHSSSRLVKEI